MYVHMCAAYVHAYMYIHICAGCAGTNQTLSWSQNGVSLYII